MRPVFRKRELLRDKHRVVVLHKHLVVLLHKVDAVLPISHRGEGRRHDNEVGVAHLCLAFVEGHLVEDVEYQLYEPPCVRGQRLDQLSRGHGAEVQVAEGGLRQLSDELLDDPRDDVDVQDLREWREFFVMVEDVDELVELALHRRKTEDALLAVVGAVDARAAVRDEVGDPEDDRGAPRCGGLVRDPKE